MAIDTASTPPEVAPELPLEGLNVIELFAIGPVPFVGLQLLQMGASVTRVSPPQSRDIGIAMHEDADLLNRGKANTAINLKSAEGLYQLLELLFNTDVLNEGFRPGVSNPPFPHPGLVTHYRGTSS
ncbi:MAG: CoA transferase [Granulosicoccus sp.]